MAKAWRACPATLQRSPASLRASWGRVGRRPSLPPQNARACPKAQEGRPTTPSSVFGALFGQSGACPSDDG
eukprot:12151060-Alexandrium_andersonii.AAC.1